MFNYALGDAVELTLVTGEKVNGVVTEVYDDYGIRVEDFGIIWRDDVAE